MSKKSLKIYEIEYLMSEDLSEDDLYNMFETSSLFMSLLCEMFKVAGYSMTNQDVVKTCRENENWCNEYCWTKPQRHKFKNEIMDVIKNVYQYREKTCENYAENWLMHYGLIDKQVLKHKLHKYGK